jgi:hypothetical protein
MDGMQDAPAVGLRASDQSQLIEGEHEGLLAQHMESPVEGHPAERCVGSRRRADIKEVKGFGGEQRLDLSVESGIWKMPPGLDETLLQGISGGNDLSLLASFPSRQMSIDRYIPQADDGASQHSIVG